MFFVLGVKIHLGNKIINATNKRSQIANKKGNVPTPFIVQIIVNEIQIIVAIPLNIHLLYDTCNCLLLCFSRNHTIVTNAKTIPAHCCTVSLSF